MIKKTEKEIMQGWEDTEMVVSITCVAFNHEYCIHEALDSFLMQETNFPFEVIINDDVSTDKTVEIIKQYESKFPNIIKPVFQNKNQFSQGINTMAILFPKVTGKYVAFCDGDDYWTDKEKLKIQVEEMKKHPDVDMSFHPTYKLFNGIREEVLAKHAESNKVFTPQEIILGGGEFCPTVSVMFTKRIISSLPDWMGRAIPGDYVSQIMGSIKGGALYINRCMSIYRVGVESSWTITEFVEDSEKRKKTLYVFNERLEVINNSFDKRFQKEVDEVIHKGNLDFIKTRSLDVSIREDVFKHYQDTFSVKEKILWYLLYKNQTLLNALKAIKTIATSRLKPSS